jgi:hypothetical protein
MWHCHADLHGMLIVLIFGPQFRDMVIELAFGPLMGLKLQPEEAREVLQLALTVQAGLFSAPIYFPGTQVGVNWPSGLKRPQPASCLAPE